jgi:hypothetical protein
MHYHPLQLSSNPKLLVHVALLYVIDSYSENEIPKDGKRSTIQLVHEMGLEKARRIYGENYQCLVVIF